MTGPMLRERLRDAGLSAWELATYSASTRTGPLSRRDCPRTRAWRAARQSQCGGINSFQGPGG